MLSVSAVTNAASNRITPEEEINQFTVENPEFLESLSLSEDSVLEALGRLGPAYFPFVLKYDSIRKVFYVPSESLELFEEFDLRHSFGHGDTFVVFHPTEAQSVLREVSVSRLRGLEVDFLNARLKNRSEKIARLELKVESLDRQVSFQKDICDSIYQTCDVALKNDWNKGLKKLGFLGIIVVGTALAVN